MKAIVTVALISALIVVVSCEEDRSKWADPNDMINFDHASNRMVNKKSQSGKDKDADSQAEPVKCLGEKLECPACDCHREDCPPCPPQPECDCEKAALPLLRKYTQNLLTHLRDQMPVHKTEQYVMHISLSSDQIEIFQKFVNTGDRRHVHDVHHILTVMVDRMAATRLGWLEKLAEKIEFKIGMTLDRLLQFVSLATLASIVLLIEIKLQIAWRRRVSQLIVLMFIISVPWTWFDLYKEAEIHQESKLSSIRPEDCEPGAKGYMHAFKSLFTLQQDKCLQYYESLMMDPLIKVPPTKAIAVTFVRFFVAPLKDVGMALSEFLRALLVDLPLTLYPIAMGMVCLFVFLLMVFCSGYRIRLPFYLLTMEPSEQYAIAGGAGGNVQAVQQAVTEASQQTLTQLEQLREKLEGTQQQLSDKLQHLEKVQQLAIEYSQSFGPPSPASTGSPTIQCRRASADNAGDLPIIQSQSQVMTTNGSQSKPTGAQSLSALTVEASVIKTGSDNSKSKKGNEAQAEAGKDVARSEEWKKGTEQGSGEGKAGREGSGAQAPGCVSIGGMVDTLLPDGVIEGRSST